MTISYLITGGAGFIGSHLADYLIDQGHRVTIFDDLSSGKISNINSKCNFIQGCITDVKTLKSALKDIDYCYHLAAIASIQESMQNWEWCNRVNFLGSLNVFLLASSLNIPVIFASSAAVYGVPKFAPIAETSSICPISPYGLDKYSSEFQAKLLSDIRGLKCVALRFFNVYGSRQDPCSEYSGVISKFIDRINRSLPLHIYGDGKQERDFIFVSDVVQALYKSQKYLDSNRYGVFNLCTGIGSNINDLAQKLFSIHRCNNEISYKEARSCDIYQSIGNASKLQKYLGLKANISLADGLKTLCLSQNK
ncbi:MAG: NAD-dependent epimerase/dehydratase family protein [Rickettsiaceae bacterium]